MQLRDYQQRTIDQIRNQIKDNFRRKARGVDNNIIVYAPTGAGKTCIIASIADAAAKKGNKTLMVLDRLVLIPQTLDKLKGFNTPVSILHSAYEYDEDAPIQLASIDTLYRRINKDTYELSKDIKLIIIDEAHHSLAPKFNPLFDFAEEMGIPVIGFTATPEVTNKRKSLLDRFSHLVVSCSIVELIGAGWLCPFSIQSSSNSSLAEELSKVSIRNGDYCDAPLSKVLQQEKHLNHTVDTWIEKAKGKKSIFFGSTIEHCDLLCDTLAMRGITAFVVHANLGHEERLDIYELFAQGEIDVLLSVGVLCEGFDVPSVECVVLARPTKSMIIYIQQIGRGLRISPSTGKTDCLILDVAENYQTHGSPLEYIPEALAQKKTQEKCELPTKECHNCGTILPIFAVLCSGCGTSFHKEKTFSDVLKPLFLVESLTMQYRETQPYHTPRGFYQHKLIQAMNKKYKPEYAVMQYNQQFGQYPTQDIKRHALFSPTFSMADYEMYMEYLQEVKQKKDLSSSWVLKWLTTEFGEVFVRKAQGLEVM
jgi:superfamily II DNA or RNA helicase